MIFQQFNLLSSRTALQNVMFGLEVSGRGGDEVRSRALQALADVGLSDKADAYPAQLSGGQKQRVALARALATEPSILLCDEATSALDPHTALSILRLLKSLKERRGMTLVIVTHDIKVASYLCDRAIVLEKGRVVDRIDMRAPQPASLLGKFFFATAKGWTGMSSGIGAVIGCLLGAYVGRFITRRMAYFLLCLGSLIACAVLFRGIDTYGPVFLTLTFFVGALTAAFYGWLPLYLPELFPTRVRATGQGLAFNAGRILAAVGALQMGALMQSFDGSYAKAGAIITLVYVFGLGLIWLAPETKGKPLPE
jgi:energy-coupling factor transporter ATP-binding protein EcfA2